ncbi:MAG: ATP-binding cassette domain-containing protein [Planctomycetota bacterium]|nr:ATP-binding cassette domain-containing protein [Planctomycetota bacterium]
MIVVKSLSKWFGKLQALKEVSFEVAKGQILGFLGPNGAGKTTAMRVIACFFPPSSGIVTVGGFDCVRDSMEVRRRVGYMPENVPLYPEMRVSEYVRYRAALKGVPARDRTARVAEALDKCALGDVKNKVIGHLSKGYRQRAGIADALVSMPEVLILDEPTIGLDPGQIRQTRQVISELGGAHTVLLSTHILPEVEMICTHTVVINRGQIVASGSLKDLSAAHARNARIVVVVAGPSQQIAAELARVPGVANVESLRQLQAGAVSLTIEPSPDSDPRGELVKAIVARGWALKELRTEALTLEEIFVRIVAEKAA